MRLTQEQCQGSPTCDRIGILTQFLGYVSKLSDSECVAVYGVEKIDVVLKIKKLIFNQKLKSLFLYRSN